MVYYRGFVPPKRPPPTLLPTRIFGAGVWFWIMYRFYWDGGHHFGGHHAWTEPKAIAYLEEVDKKYGTRYALDNMHHH